MRSFVPAFGFGGSIRNQEVIGQRARAVRADRAYCDGSLAWRRQRRRCSRRELGLKSLWLQTTRRATRLQRWLRLEGFYSGAFQDIDVAGGHVDRNRIGVQVVTARPVRLQ